MDTKLKRKWIMMHRNRVTRIRLFACEFIAPASVGAGLIS